MKVAIVGEAWGEKEALAKAPFQGSSGWLLRKMLRTAGVRMDYCLVTNVFNQQPPADRISAFYTKGDGVPGYDNIEKGKRVSANYTYEIERLWDELDEYQPDRILALGRTALWALCNVSNLKAVRGTFLRSFRGSYLVMPTWHPAAVLRQYSLRTVAELDIVKGLGPRRKIIRPTVYVPETREDLKVVRYDLLNHKTEDYLACDIETAATQITEVGFAFEDKGWTIPFWHQRGNYWSAIEDELFAWQIVREVCHRQQLVGQNFSYDMLYLWQVMGIPCPKFLGDTMLLHHAMEPEMEKSLGFLASTCIDMPAWKFTRIKDGQKED